MEERSTFPHALVPLIGLAAFVIVVAGMRAAQSLVVPFLLALFISILCAPPLFWLKSKRVPTIVALVIVITGVLAVGLAVMAVIGQSANQFRGDLPELQAGLRENVVQFLDWVEKATPINPRDEEILRYFDPQRMVGFIGNMLTGFAGMLTNALLIIITVIFILLEWTILEDKLYVVFHGSPDKMEGFYETLSKVRRYMALKTFVSLITGLLAYFLLLAVGVKYPMLWALITFAFNYVPNIGSIIAALPPIVVTLSLQGVWPAVWVAVGYVAINMIMGNFVEPRIVGRDLGLSTLVVFISLAFWYWVLGYVGMLLSVPLTVTAKLILEYSESTRWLAVLLGSGVRVGEADGRA